MSNADAGICFIINLFLSTPQRVFEFFAGWLFDLLNIDIPNVPQALGDIFACGI